MNQKKTHLTGSASVFLVADVVASATYYRDKLGFDNEGFSGDPPCFAILGRSGYSLMLSQVDQPEKIQPNSKFVNQMWSAYFWVDDIEAIYKELKQAGAKIESDVHLKEYGVKEFEVRDLDGYVVAFGEVVD